MLMLRVFIVAAVLFAQPAQSNLVAGSSRMTVVESGISVFDEYTLLATQNRLLALYATPEGRFFRLFDSLGMETESGEMPSEPSAAPALNGSRLAFFDVNCRALHVLNLGNGELLEFPLPLQDNDSCFSTGEIIWTNDTSLALHIDVQTWRAQVGGRPELVIYSEPLTLDLSTGLFTMVDLEPEQDRTNISRLSLTANDGTVVWSYAAAGGLRSQVISSTSEPIRLPFGTGEELRLQSVLMGDILVQGGLSLSDQRQLPVYQSHNLSNSTSGGLTLPIPDTVTLSQPSLSASLVNAQRLGDAMIIQWELFDGIRRQNRFPLPLVLDTEANLAGLSNIVTQSFNVDALDALDIHAPSVIRGATADGLWVLWRGANRTGLSLTSLELAAQNSENDLLLSVIGVCNEEQAWVSPLPTGDLQGLELRTANTDVVVAADSASQLEGLYPIGTTFQLVEQASQQVVATQTVSSDDASPCNRQVSLEVVAAPTATARGVMDVTWNATRLPAEIRIGSPTGTLFVLTQNNRGTQRTGPWVRDNMLFFLLDERGEVVSVAIARFPGG